VKLTNVKIITPTGVYVTHRLSGPTDWQADLTPWPAGQSLSQFSPRLDGHVATLVHKGYPMLEVNGTREEWPASNVNGRPKVHILQTDLVKLVQAPLCLYKRLLMMKVDTHTPHLGDSTCKDLILSVVARRSLVGREARL
jgi:hypothetical protein